MIRQGRDLARDHVRSAEAVVIGSGAGGAVVAWQLAVAGWDTVCLEAGPHVPTDHMTQSELDMLPRLFQERGQRATRDQSISLLQGRSLGGGTTHNTGLCVPVGEERWEHWAREHAVPTDYDSFRPYLGDVLNRIGARVADEDEINANNRLLRAGAEQLGWKYFVARHNRIRCSGCGYCTLGCAYNRKLSVIPAFLSEAVCNGLEVWVETRVERLRPGRRTSVEAHTASGRRLTIEAPVVVVAAGAIDTPLILRGAGLAARAGSSLRLHPFAPVGAHFDDEVVNWRGVPQTIIIDEHMHADHGYLLIAAAGQPALTAVMSAATGAAHRQMMEGYRHLAAGGVLLHDRTRGRVTRRRDGKPRVDYWPRAADIDDFRRGIRHLAEMYFALGARRVLLPFVDRPVLDSPDQLDGIAELPFRPHSVVLGSVHAQGTCPMGKDPSRSVTSGHGEVHGAQGVFVGDASLFPTSLGLPPQVTIMALAARLGQHLHLNRKRLAP